MVVTIKKLNHLNDVAMKRLFVQLIALKLFCFFGIIGYSQTEPKYSFSTSLLRYEKSDNFMYPEFIPKIMAGFEIQQIHKKYSFGFKYEYGYNDKEETCEKCNDHLEGTAYMRENNVYLNAHRTLLTLTDSMIKLNAGLSVYYSNLYYYGTFYGGFTGRDRRVINQNIHNLGLMPFIGLQIFPVKKIFLSIQGSYRQGLVKFNQRYYWPESTLMAPEFKIGVIF